jgi:hypothetical protein
MLNRGLVIVRAKEPFREWLLSLPDSCDETIEEINEDSSVYLLPEFEDDKQRNTMLKKFFAMIFEDQLAAWSTQEDDWPPKRNLQMFKKWFDVEFHSTVDDLVDGVLLDQ